MVKRDFGRIVTETPYNADWVNCIKAVIPQQYRKYEGGAMWSFDPRYFNCVRMSIEHFWGTAYTDSTGGVTEPQVTNWKESWDVFMDEKPKREHERKQKYEPPPKRGRATGSLYATLFVAENAPKEVITAAYRALSVVHHPDKGGDTETMARINGAYTELKKLGRV